MPLEGPDASEALEWLARARSSLALAKQPKPEAALWADLCYQAQQAAEKALKAVYHRRGLPHRFTHDLEELGKGIEGQGVLVPDVVREAVVLTRYAVETRYPGPAEPVSEEDYRRAVELAEGVVAWAERTLA